MFSQINQQNIDDCWQIIMIVIAHQTEEEFLNEVTFKFENFKT